MAPIGRATMLKRRNVSPYVFLAIGALWLLAAIVLYKMDFALTVLWLSALDHRALTVSLLSALPSVLFLGWIAPVLLGSWLLWRK